MDPSTFRTNFPEFGDPTVYPDPRINLWLGYAASRVSSSAWGTLADLGLQLFTAHMLVIASRRLASQAAGGSPGMTAGVVTAKAVDKVSQSMDAASVIIEGAGNWNATDYGVQFYQLAEMMGAGGYQIGCR